VRFSAARAPKSRDLSCAIPPAEPPIWRGWPVFRAVFSIRRPDRHTRLTLSCGKARARGPRRPESVPNCG
jgi:hypothetical protein